MITFLKQTLQLLLAPTKGWEDVASNSPDARRSLIHGQCSSESLRSAVDHVADGECYAFDGGVDRGDDGADAHLWNYA